MKRQKHSPLKTHKCHSCLCYRSHVVLLTLLLICFPTFKNLNCTHLYKLMGKFQITTSYDFIFSHLTPETQTKLFINRQHKWIFPDNTILRIILKEMFKSYVIDIDRDIPTASNVFIIPCMFDSGNILCCNLTHDANRK